MSLNNDRIKFKRSVRYTLSFVATIWVIKIFEILFGMDFGSLGILPRTLTGSIGIFLSPLIHGTIFHLLSNTFPLVILGIGIFYFYDKIALQVIILIYLMTGAWVWLAARDAYHIGASGLVYGLLTFLLFSGFLRKDKKALSVSLIILIIYGGTFVSGVLPSNPGISWESHFMGAIAGIFCAVYFRKSIIEEVENVLEQQSEKTHYIYSYSTKDKESHKKSVFHYNLKIKNDKDNISNTSL